MEKEIRKAEECFDYGNLSHLIPMMGLRPIEEVYDWSNTLIYGPYGDGKTHLAGTAALVPEMRDILYISLEGGEKTLKVISKMCKKNKIDPNCIMVLPIQTYKQYAQLYETLKVHINYRDSNNLDGLRMVECQLRGVEILQKIKWQPSTTNTNQIVKEMVTEIQKISKDKEKLKTLIPNPKKFRTVITDSLTEAQKYCMYQILGINPLKQKIDIEPDSAQWGDWGASREMIQFLVRRYRNLAINSIWITGVNETEDSRKQKYYSPMLPGKLSKDVQGLVDTVGYIQKVPLESGKVIRRLYLEGGKYGSVNIAAKHRYGNALKGCYIENPTMQKLYDLEG